jgi:formaldehyde-activating enzyme involved in methanogenesis
MFMKKTRSKQPKKKRNTSRLQRKRGGNPPTANKQLLAESQNSALSLQTTKNVISSGLGVGQALVGVSNLTGVGIPIAGALAGALLIASKLAKIYINNSILFPITLDTIVILSNSYKLHDLIQTSISICQRRLRQSNSMHNEIVKRVNIDEDIKKHILTKIGELTAFLLKTATQEVLNVLLKDADVMRSGFSKYVNQENISRSSTLNKMFGSIERSATRTFNSNTIKEQIADNLSLINSFFIILKSQYDFVIQTYKQELSSIWSDVITEIENTDEFKSYVVHEESNIETIGKEVDKIINSEEQSMKEASSQAVESEKEVNEILSSLVDVNEVITKEEESEKSAEEALKTELIIKPKRKIIRRSNAQSLGAKEKETDKIQESLPSSKDQGRKVIKHLPL